MNKILALLCASVILNILCLPIAAPIMFENAKMATASKLFSMANSLDPKPEIPKVQKEVLEKATYIPVKVMPPKLDIEKIAIKYPAANSDIIREILENN